MSDEYEIREAYNKAREDVEQAFRHLRWAMDELERVAYWDDEDADKLHDQIRNAMYEF